MNRTSDGPHSPLTYRWNEDCSHTGKMIAVVFCSVWTSLFPFSYELKRMTLSSAWNFFTWKIILIQPIGYSLVYLYILVKIQVWIFHFNVFTLEARRLGKWKTQHSNIFVSWWLKAMEMSRLGPSAFCSIPHAIDF